MNDAGCKSEKVMRRQGDKEKLGSSEGMRLRRQRVKGERRRGQPFRT
jgi:hypothetical protein